ncbi:fibronectin type III domain-containing protein [Lysobacter arenosi]|uniref:Fibronectin type III domain-containing protein n=1 Tax=Lysobacter arenosi TaxID=2795387 RepID=A0ABX7R6X4_9GAMM|nr:putative Ig domain-containing protein [Lysobacter arenosi]QSX73809.1 fibronectin type III domain-containing protein [Lysobacter arenosi]
MSTHRAWRRFAQSMVMLLCAAAPLAQAAPFNDDFTSPFFDSPTTAVTRVLGGTSFRYTFTGSGDLAWDDTTYLGNPMLSANSSAPPDASIERVTIARSDGADFIFQGLLVDVLMGESVTVQAYRDGVPTGTPRTVAPGTSVSLSFGRLLVDEVRLTSSDFFLTNFDNISGDSEAPVPPVVSDSRISVSGASGTGGAYKIGDTVTATWNNTAGGDNNGGVTGVTVDFSQFGGGSAVTATESSGTWTATYTITASAIDAANRNVSVTATNVAGSTTRADSSNATVDSVAPTVSDGRITVSGASGTAGAYKIGDTVTATWNNTAGGDNNSDSISSVTVNFAQFGGGAAVAATNSSGTWTATYTITAGSIDNASRNVSVTATDNAGNATTTSDSSNATVDNIRPTASSIAVNGTPTAGATSIAFTVAFSEPVGNVSTDDFTLVGTGTASASIDSVSAAGGASVNVNIVGITGNGSLRLDLNAATDITDDAGNAQAGFNGGSVHTVVIPVAPGAPTIGTATTGDAQASITFTAPASNGGSAITTYTATASPGGAFGTCAGPAACTATVTGLSNGTAYTFTVTATNAIGTSVSSAASNPVTPKASQSITFANPGAQNFGTSPTLTASATSGLAPTFSSSTTGVCTVTSNGVLTFVTAGTCTIDADQAGNSTVDAASTITRSFTVNSVVPSAPTIGTATAGDTQATVTFTAPASTGGAAITQYTATASPGGATATGAASPITVTGLTNGEAYTFTVTATNMAGTGSASAASNSVMPAAPQLITFNNPGPHNFGTSPVVTATATSGLTPTLSSSTTGVCTITPVGVLTFVTAGRCTINADQGGNSSYLPAPQVSRSFTVSAVAPGAPTAVSASAGNAQANIAFTAPAFVGGAAITGYTVTSSPGGVTATGAASPLTMTNLVNGVTYTFTVTATNAAGTGVPSAPSNAVTPVPALVASPVSANIPYAANATAITLNIVGNANAVAVAGAPAHGTAVASGTSITYRPNPGYAGPDSFSYTATDAYSTTAPASVSITVANAAVALDASAMPGATGGSAYHHQLHASGGSAPYSFQVVSANLPAGLVLAGNGELSGTPTVAGSFDLTVQVSDSSTGTGPFSDQRVYTLVIAAPQLVFALSAMPDATHRAAYDQALDVSGGTAPYTFAVIAGALPAGLSLDAAGRVSGVPEQAGQYAFTVEAHDANGFAAT